MGKKVYPVVVGTTLGSHEKFLEKIKKKGATIVETEEESDETVVFCPIVSRFVTDIHSALSNISGERKVILVAMHHTYDPNYILPDSRSFDKTHVKLFVECLFFDKRGLYKCERNSKALKSVYKELGLEISFRSSKNQANNAEPKESRNTCFNFKKKRQKQSSSEDGCSKMD